MADTVSSPYQFTGPEVGASDDTWGTKLNANWAKLDALLESGFDNGTPTFIGDLKATSLPTTYTEIITLSRAQPEIRYQETDQTDPAGRYRFVLNNSVFFLQYATAANWGSVNSVFQHNKATDVFTIASAETVVAGSLDVNSAVYTGATLQMRNDTSNTVYFYKADGTTRLGYLQGHHTSDVITLVKNNPADNVGQTSIRFENDRVTIDPSTVGLEVLHGGVGFRFDADAKNIISVGGVLNFPGNVKFDAGIEFGSDVASAAGDLSRHIDLYNGTYGFSVTSNALNIVAPSAAVYNMTTGDHLAVNFVDAKETTGYRLLSGTRRLLQMYVDTNDDAVIQKWANNSGNASESYLKLSAATIYLRGGVLDLEPEAISAAALPQPGDSDERVRIVGHIADGGHGGLGSYAMLRYDGASVVEPGNNITGNLFYASADGNGSMAASGTWKCMGDAIQGSGGLGERTTIWLKIS